MKFSAKLEKGFILVIVLALGYMTYNYYVEYQFKHSPISEKIQSQIEAKEQEVIANIKKHYGVDFRVPMIISDTLPSNLYGLAHLEKNGNITIYINKKRIKESLPYVLDDVIAHEYAHAFMFAKLSNNKEGHSVRWKEVCLKLGGAHCNQYVNHSDVLMGKMPF